MAAWFTALRVAWMVTGSSPKPPPMLVDTSGIMCIEKAQLLFQSAGVASEVNLRITQARKHTRDPPWL